MRAVPVTPRWRVNITYTNNMLHVSGSYEPSSGIKFKNYCFFQFCLTVFWAIALGIPFALQIRITVCMVLGAHCCCYINTVVVSTESTLCFTINRLSYHTTGWLLLVYIVRFVILWVPNFLKAKNVFFFRLTNETTNTISVHYSAS